MTPYILDRGTKIVMEENNVKDPHLFTEKLLDFKDMKVQQSIMPQIIFTICSYGRDTNIDMMCVHCKKCKII